MNSPLEQRLNALVRDLEARQTPYRAPVLHRFTLHLPCNRRESLRVSCWCGADEFASRTFETHDLERLFRWMSEHEHCRPRGEG